MTSCYAPQSRHELDSSLETAAPYQLHVHINASGASPGQVVSTEAGPDALIDVLIAGRRHKKSGLNVS